MCYLVLCIPFVFMYFANSDGCGSGLDEDLHEIKGCYGCELPI